MSRKPKICVIGAGIVGISTVVRLIEVYGSSIELSIIADKFYNETTTYGCGGLWEPYQILGTPSELINRWGKDAFDYFLALHNSPDAEESGVKIMTSYILHTENDDSTVPSWADIPFSFTCLARKDLDKMNIPSKYCRGFSFGTLVIDQKYYLRYEMKKLNSLGVQFIQRHIFDISELYADNYVAIINCSGLGAMEVVKDSTMYPIRGQVLRVKAPWMQSIWFFGRSYIIPNIDTCVIGGTAQKGDFNTGVSSKDTDEIVEAVCELFPAFRTAPIESVWTGLRPGRTPLRLDSEWIPSVGDSEILVVHCYGHGGSGVTLGMGCAYDVVDNYISKLGLRRYQSKL